MKVWNGISKKILVWNGIWKKILVGNGIWNGRFLVWNGRKLPEWNIEKSSSISFHTMSCFDMLKNLVEGNVWGKMLNFAYGRHKLFPQFHNAYLHRHVDDYSPNSISDKIMVNNSTVMVIKPGERNVLRCNFCKNKGHSLASCPQKWQRSQNRSKRIHRRS